MCDLFRNIFFFSNPPIRSRRKHFTIHEICPVGVYVMAAVLLIGHFYSPGICREIQSMCLPAGMAEASDIGSADII